MNEHILWLVSWYPNELSPFDGDFIQRHARAASLYKKIDVIYLKKDEKQFPAGNSREVVHTTGNLTEKIIFYNSSKTRIGFFYRFLSARRYNKLYRQKLLEYINENGKPALVNVHVAFKAGLQALWLKRKFGIPFVISEHWSGYLPEAITGIKNFSVYRKKLVSRIFKKASSVSMVSNELGRSIVSLFGIEGYRLIPNVVDTSIFYPEVKESGTTTRFIHISGLDYKKNIFRILEAAQIVKKRAYDFRLDIFGPFTPAIEAKIKELSLNQAVKLQGEVQQVVLAKSLKGMEALILYSRYETFGCAVIEANACGVPVIVSDLPVFRENIIEYENGIFAEKNNPGVLADKMIGFIEGRYNFDKQKIAAKTMATFSFEVVGRQFADWYDNVINT